MSEPMYALDRNLPSCEAPKQMLHDLEAYMTAKCNELVPSPRLRFAHCEIADTYGNLRLSRIDEYAYHVFPDDIKAITFTFNHDQIIEITLALRTDMLRSYVRVKTRGNNARELASGIYEGLLNIIRPYTNRNDVWRSENSILMLIPIVVGLPFLMDSLVKVEARRMATIYAVALVAVIVVAYIIMFRVSPRTVFDTRRNQKNARVKVFLWYGVGASLIASVIFTVASKAF